MGTRGVPRICGTTGKMCTARFRIRVRWRCGGFRRNELSAAATVAGVEQLYKVVFHDGLSNVPLLVLANSKIAS